LKSAFAARAGGQKSAGTVFHFVPAFGLLPSVLKMSEPIIDLHSDDYFMGAALRQAAKAYEKGEVPVGAVIVRDGHIIARACNQVEELKDATAHAEMLALTQAQTAVGDWRLTDCTLYVTKEPCPMCAGAGVHTRLARVVFGAGDPKGGAAGGALNLLQFATLNHRCAVTAGVRLEECRALLRRFFAEQRTAKKNNASPRSERNDAAEKKTSAAKSGFKSPGRHPRPDAV
jgi:tRNA(adenine34) deaminase